VGGGGGGGGGSWGRGSVHGLAKDPLVQRTESCDSASSKTTSAEKDHLLVKGKPVYEVGKRRVSVEEERKGAFPNSQKKKY